MFPFESLNWLAIIASVVAAMVLGMIWYGPLFGKPWMKLVGLTQKDAEKDMAQSMILGLLNSLVIAVVISLLLNMMNITELSAGLQLGALVSIGFFATNEASAVIWQKTPCKLFLINAGYAFVMVEATVLILMQWPW
jgi:hypothetical protein